MVMFDHDRSAARGKMSARKLLVFKHESALGNAPAQELFDLVKVSRIGNATTPPRSYGDYQVTVDQTGLPRGVELQVRL
jgi:CRISPR-associated protein Csd2